MTESEQVATALDFLTAIYNMPDKAQELAAQAIAEIEAGDERVVRKVHE